MASVPRCPQGRVARAAGLPLQRLVTACPGLVPDPLGPLTHAFISAGFWSPFSRGQGAGHAEEHLCPSLEYLGIGPNYSAHAKWVSAHVRQLSCAVSTPIPPSIPSPRGCWTWRPVTCLWVRLLAPLPVRLSLAEALCSLLFLNIPCSFTPGKVQSLPRLLLYYSRCPGRQLRLELSPFLLRTALRSWFIVTSP